MRSVGGSVGLSKQHTHTHFVVVRGGEEVAKNETEGHPEKSERLKVLAGDGKRRRKRRQAERAN